MDLQLDDIQKTALVALCMRASETLRTTPRIHDESAQAIIDALGVSFDELTRELGIDLDRYDLFLSHEAVIARTIMFGEALRALIEQHPNALCVNLGCAINHPETIALRRSTLLSARL